jgi:hypothetical protein
VPYHGLSKLSYPFHDRTITVIQSICIIKAQALSLKRLSEIKRSSVSMPRGVSSVVRRVVFVMKGGVVYKNAAGGVIPLYTGVQP